MTKKIQNIIQKGYDNPVIIIFSFNGEFSVDGLSNFTDIILEIGDETYSTSQNPENLFLNGSNELRLKIGDSTNLPAGSYIPKIVGFTPTYDDGYLLNGTTQRRLPSCIQVRD